MILGAVQVRLGSTRLPKKALLEILGRPMLHYIVERAEHSKLIDKVVISTSTRDKEIIEFAKENGIEYYAGSEQDLIDRLYQTARKFEADALVRITGDCPLADPGVMDRVIQCYLDNEGEVDYVSNVHPPTYPDGLDTDVYPTETLKTMWDEIKDDFQREWVYNYLIENKDRFRILNVSNEKDLSGMRWTVDYKEDLEFVSEIFRNLYKEGEAFTMEDIVDLLKKNPKLIEINEEYVRDAAYYAALDERKNNKEV